MANTAPSSGTIMTRNGWDDCDWRFPQYWEWVRMPGRNGPARAFPMAGILTVVLSHSRDGASIWAEFEAGDPQAPIWSGVWLAGANPGEMPAEAAENPTTCKSFKKLLLATLYYWKTASANKDY